MLRPVSNIFFVLVVAILTFIKQDVMAAAPEPGTASKEELAELTNRVKKLEGLAKQLEGVDAARVALTLNDIKASTEKIAANTKVTWNWLFVASLILGAAMGYALSRLYNIGNSVRALVNKQESISKPGST
jgi:hypothetical protein